MEVPRCRRLCDTTSAAASAEVLGELAAMIDKGQLEIPIAGVYALSDVQAAFQELGAGTYPRQDRPQALTAQEVP